MYYQFKRTIVVEMYSTPVEADTEKAAAKLVRKKFNPVCIKAYEAERDAYEYNAEVQEREGFGTDLNPNFCVEIQEEEREEYDSRFRETVYPISEDEYCDRIKELFENSSL